MLTQQVGQFESLVHIPNTSFTSDQKKLLANILLKCADISNVVKPFHIAKRWAEILCNEFFIQGSINTK
jgi:hypothetical protein